MANTKISKDFLDTTLLTNTTGLTQLYPSDTAKPVAILCFGDSNMAGIGGSDATVQTANTNVFFYASDGIGTPYQNPATDLTWRNVDPDAATVTDYDDTSVIPYWGLLRNSNGSTAFAVGDRIQKRMNNDTYVVSTWHGGTTNLYWQNGGASGQEGMTAFNLYLQDALDAIPNSPGYFDIVVMSGGGNDSLSDHLPQDYVDQHKAMRDYMVSQGWIREGITQFFQLEPVQSSITGIENWVGMQYLANQTDEYVRIVSSVGEIFDPIVDAIHIPPKGLNQFGVVVADAAVAGISTKYATRDQVYIEYLAPVLGGNMDANGKAITDIAYLDVVTPTATVTADPTIPPIKFSGTTTYNYAQAVSSILGRSLWNETNITQVSPGAFSQIAGLKLANLHKNDPSFAVTPPGLCCVATEGVIEADDQTLSLATVSDFNSGSIARATVGSAGALTVALYTNFAANGKAQAGATISARHGFLANSITEEGGGVVTSQTGVTISPLTAGDNNTHILVGTTTIPSGNYGIYQSNSVPNKWGGGQYYKYVGKTANYTGTAADHIVRFTSGTCTFTFPDAATTIVGQEYILRNDSGANLTLDKVTGGDTITPSTVIATGNFRRYATDGVATWFQVG